MLTKSNKQLRKRIFELCQSQQAVVFASTVPSSEEFTEMKQIIKMEKMLSEREKFI